MPGKQHDGAAPVDPAEQQRAEKAAAIMLADDLASRLLGLSLDVVTPGFARMRMVVTKSHLNGHATCHGGFLFTLADSAFAVACNSFNQVAVASSASIEFIAPARIDDVLVAESNLQKQGRISGLYDVVIRNQDDTRIALFRGRSYRLGRPLFEESQGEAS